MAGSLKPDNVKGKEGTLSLGDNNCDYGSVSFLLDETTSLFWMYDYNRFNEYFIFSIPTTSNIYAYGTEANSSLGTSGKSLTLYKLKDDNSYGVVGIFETKVNSWYTLFSDLKPGTYKITANGDTISFCEWYVETAETFFIKKNSQFFSINEDYYNSDIKNYTPIENINLQNNQNGFSLNKLFTEITVGGETFKPIDKFDNFQLVCEKNKSLKLNGLKSNRELIVANGDIATDIANSIDYFKLFTSQSDNGSIRIAISIDKGNTWNTITNGKLSLLSCTIPLKPYTLLSEEELVLWNEARDIIYESGITIDLFNTVDFNNLTTESVIPANMRFAYVINKPTFHDEAIISKLEWQFDAKGSMQLMKDSEQQIDIYGRSVKYKSLIDNPLIKVNVML